MTIRVDPREHYRHCSDDELQRLAEGYDQLMPEAQQALLSEMQARGMSKGVETAHAVEAQVAEAEARATRLPDYFAITAAPQPLEGWFQVITPRQNLRFPNSCPGCGKPAQTTCSIGTGNVSKATMSTRMTTTTLVYKVPHCRSCAGEIKGSTIWFILAYLAAVAIVIVLVGVLLDWQAGGIAALLLMLLSLNQVKKLRLKSPGGIFMLDFDDASTSFAVKDRAYADRFCRLNQQSDSKDGAPAA